MTARPIAFDLTRLIARLTHANPTGIDRVDLAYARHVLGGQGARFGLVSTPLGPRVLDRAEASRLVEAVLAAWTETIAAGADPVLRALAEKLGAETGRGRAAPHRADRHDLRRRRTIQLRTVWRALRAPGIGSLPPGTVYLHSSHQRLDQPERFDWLHDRRDIRCVFFVHDLIPISHPEYGRAGEAARHSSRMATIARHAAHVVVNSGDVGRRFAGYLASRSLAVPPVTVAPLGVEPVFLDRTDEALTFHKPTFLVCGTIEPRKNHLLLLQLWRDLAARRGLRTPHLVVVGRRGWEADGIVDMLERCPAVAAHVSEVTGLSTPGLALLMRSATALLMPSFIEGYGLPVVEAAASGLPVVASDIQVHREIGEGFAEFLDPLDGRGWEAAIEQLCEAGSPSRAHLAAPLPAFAAPSWTAHFSSLDAVLASLDVN